MNKAVGFMNFMLRHSLHSYKETATGTILAGPCLDLFIKLSPPAKIEVADAEIRPLGVGHGQLQCG